jgi:hypothetical protein
MKEMKMIESRGINVVDENSHVATPKEFYAELIDKHASDQGLALDLESVDDNGRCYAVTANENRTDAGTAPERINGLANLSATVR